MRHSHDRYAYRIGPGAGITAINFQPEVLLFPSNEDGSHIRSWTPIFKDRRAWGPDDAMRHAGFEVEE